MKKNISIILGGSLLAFILLGMNIQSVFSEAPTGISTCLELQMIGNDEDYPSSGDYVLTGNINCGEGASEGNNTRSWNANEDEWEEGIIGGTLIQDGLDGVVNNGYYGFDPISLHGGSLDGAGYTISNLWIFRKGQTEVGIFDRIENNSSITNLTLSNVSIVGANSTGGLSGLVMDGSSVNNVTVTNSMVRAYLSENGGGLAGQITDSTVSNITITGGNVHGSGNTMGGIGGLVIDSTVSNSNTSTDVDGGYSIGGAFGYVRDSELINIHVTGNVLGEDNETGKEATHVGGFVGQVENSTISSSSFTGTVTALQSQNWGYIDYVGGFVGYANGAIISDSFASNEGDLVTVTAQGNDVTITSIGGFIGYGTDYYDEDLQTDITSEITDSYAQGNILINNATSSVASVGGFVGTMLYSNASDSYAEVPIIIVSGGQIRNVGGFVGYTEYTDIADSYATGDISLNSDDRVRRVGGFAGYAYEDISFTDSHATGDISIEAGDYVEYVGGFVGTLEYGSEGHRLFGTGDIAIISGDYIEMVGGFAGQLLDVIIYDSYATGDISVTSADVAQYIGGFVGRTTWDDYTEIRNSYATGNVEGGNYYIGGFAGRLGGTHVYNSYATGNIAGNDSVGGFVGSINYESKTYNTYARGNVTAINTDSNRLGGYVGTLEGDVFYSYATGDVILLPNNESYRAGGFAGYKENDSIYSSYSVGEIINHETATDVGGFIGDNDFDPGQYNSGYWTGSGPALAIGNQPEAIIAYAESDKSVFKNASFEIYQYNEEVALQDDEYDGYWYFDTIWTQDDEVNNGYPYLRWSNPGNIDEGGQEEETLTPTRRRSSEGNQASPAFLASLGITLANPAVPTAPTTTPSLGEPGLCSADQIITQNLRAPSRNGVFNSYTGGIVREINILQGHLNRLGFNSGPVDGIAGPLTDGAIKRMQTFLGTKADGYVGPITRGLLNNSCGASGLQG